MIYRIKNWKDYYENNRTKELKKLQWVPIPNSHDGDGYTELVEHENGAAHLGAFIAMVQVASKCDPRGTLLRSNEKPHDSASLSRMTRLPKKCFDEVIPRLVSIGWIEEIREITAKKEISQEGAAISQDAAQKGREGKGKKEVEEKPPQEDAETDSTPTLSEIKDYCELTKSSVSPTKFFHYYSSRKWMKNWKAKFDEWTENEIERPKPSVNQLRPRQERDVTEIMAEKGW